MLVFDKEGVFFFEANLGVEAVFCQMRLIRVKKLCIVTYMFSAE